MKIAQIHIKGLRGFRKKQSLRLAQPNGKRGSGLTVLLGPNNSGKSTIVEAFRAVTQRSTPSFTEGQRNKKAGDRIDISVSGEKGKKISLRTVSAGGSETEFVEEKASRSDIRVFVVPSRRTFAPFFGKGTWNRKQYMQSLGFPSQRGHSLPNFNYRLFQIQNKPDEFNSVLKKVLPELPSWKIDQSDRGDHYLKFDFDGSFHNSDGVGEGLLSVFTIVDALYDSEEGDVIIIDEPELSLHPSLQKKLIGVILDHASTRQIVISTHSPYFVDWSSLINGGSIARVFKEKDAIRICPLKRKTIDDISKLLENLNNPHILGLAAKEVFFLDDEVILVEGQEDVVFIRRILDILNKSVDGFLWGWGVGGAPNMTKVLNILKDFGFKKIVCILDRNMNPLAKELRKEFPKYSFFAIPTDDIRDKKPRPAKEAVEGLIDSGGTAIKEQYISSVKSLIADINKYFTNNTKPITARDGGKTARPDS